MQIVLASSLIFKESAMIILKSTPYVKVPLAE